MKLTSKYNLLAFLHSQSERATIARGSISSFLIQVGFASLSFIMTTVLVRFLGSEGYGAYSNAIAWVNILVAFGLFGFNSLLIRDMAILKAQNKWALIRGLLQFSDGLILPMSLLLVLILWGMAGVLFSLPEKESLRLSLWIAAPLIPLYTFVNLRQSAMRGLQQVTRAMLPDYIIRPALTLVCIFCIYLFFPYLISAQIVIALSVVVAIIALLVSGRWLRLLLPEGFGTTRPQYQVSEWVKSAPPMFIIGGTQTLIAQMPVVMLGTLSNAKNVGYFAVASRVASLLVFLPMAVSIVMGPMIASMYSQGRKPGLQNLLKRTNRLTFAVTFLFSFTFIVFAKNILSFLGQEFTDAQTALILLTIGYLFDSGFGLSIITLMMTGHERVVAIYQSIFTILLTFLCILFIPSRGYESAALAFMVIMIVSRFIFSYVTKKKTGINTTIF